MVNRRYYDNEIERLKRELKGIDAAIEFFERLEATLPLLPRRATLGRRPGSGHTVAARKATCQRGITCENEPSE